jgi:hypothetical protein
LVKTYAEVALAGEGFEGVDTGRRLAAGVVVAPEEEVVTTGEM